MGKPGVAADPDVQAFGESAADGNPMPNIPEMGAVWANLGQAFAAMYNQVVAQAVRDAIAGG